VIYGGAGMHGRWQRSQCETCNGRGQNRRRAGSRRKVGPADGRAGRLRYPRRAGTKVAEATGGRYGSACALGSAAQAGGRARNQQSSVRGAAGARRGSMAGQSQRTGEMRDGQTSPARGAAI